MAVNFPQEGDEKYYVGRLEDTASDGVVRRSVPGTSSLRPHCRQFRRASWDGVLS